MEDLYRMLRNGHLEAQGIVDTLDAPIALLDEHFCIFNVNPAFCDVFKTDRDDVIGQSLFVLGGGQWKSPELQQLITAIIPRASAVVGYEVTHDFKGLGVRTMLVSARRLRRAGGTTKSIMVQFEDVTERRQRENVRDILLSETRHRAQNLFALARALATETQAEGLSGGEYRDAFLGRFEALLKGQSLQEDFSTADFRQVAERTLEAFGPHIHLAPGPAATLAADQIMPTVLVLHELMTNAAKYGALSARDGIVQLAWTIEPAPTGQVLRIDWREEGGPPVSEPGRRGFGSRLMQFGVSRGLGGTLRFDYEPNGLQVSFTVPLP